MTAPSKKHDRMRPNEHTLEHHEAAHAVMIVAQGGTIRLVSVTGDHGGCLPGHQPEGAEARVRVMLSGNLAERILSR